MKCFHCKKEISLSGRPGRGDACVFCGSDIKVCLNCRFYDKNAYNGCRETSADRVIVKDRANFCEFFEPGDAKGDDKRAEDPFEKLKGLFKDP